MSLTQVQHFYFTDEMMSKPDRLQDVELINRMFNDADKDGSGDIGWMEYPALDAMLREFDVGFYAKQRKQAAEAQRRNQEILASRKAKKERPAKEKQVPPKKHAAGPKQQQNSALAAAIAAQQANAVAATAEGT